MTRLRSVARAFVASPATGVCIRDRIKGLTAGDEVVLRTVGGHLGRLASADLACRVHDGLDHDSDRWAGRKRDLTASSSSRWAGSITKATNDQWGLARRAQHAHAQSLTAGVRTIRDRLCLPVGEPGSSGQPGGYRSRQEWHAKSRRLTVLEARLAAPLTHLANAPHGRYVLTGRVTFGHRGDEWRDRVEANRAVAYRIHHNPGKDRWYLDASWQRKDTTIVPLETLRAGEVIGVDMNADHLAAWRLDTHGNPTGKPRTFTYDLTGTATHRDAQVRHALTRLLHWAKQSEVLAIAVEDLDFTDSKTREKHGRHKRFRQLVSGMPTSRLRTRLLAMTAEAGIAVIAVDPAYTSRWGAQHWQKPTSTPTHKTTRHEAAAIAIGRRALGHQIRRRTTPPRQHQTDAARHRTLQAGPGTPGREETRHPGPGPRTRSAPPTRTTYAGNQATQHRSGPPTDQDTVLLSVQER